MKAEVAKANRQFGPKYGSPLTPGAASAQDFLTPVASEVDDVFTTDGASTNRRKMDSSAVFQPENFEDIADISPDPSPSRPFQTANHPSKEIEDLQQRLQHAQRQIKKLTGSIHREKEMRIDYKASSGYVHDENEPPEDAMFDDDNTASIESKLKRKVTPFRSVRGRGRRGRGGGLCHRLGNAASTPSSDYAGEADLMLSPPPPVPSIPGQFQDGTDDLDPELSEGEGDEHQPDPIQSSPSPLAVPSKRTSVDGMDPFYANVLRNVHPVALQTSQSQVQTSPTPTGAFSRAFSPAPRRTTLTQADLSGLSTGNESSDTTIRNVGVPGALSITDEANESESDLRRYGNWCRNARKITTMRA
ncbi:hypothetical protein EDD15DRAFT_2462781 [Pisolithus albus]|nr:hypothetical protein EDD15DRAFT_2462781 [Pisolithus albus]